MLVLTFKSRRIVPLPEIELTVTVTEVPEDADTSETVPDALPDTVVTEKSSAETLFALSLKVTVKVTDVSVAPGEPERLMEDTDGGDVSAGVLSTHVPPDHLQPIAELHDVAVVYEAQLPTAS
jgi:hypothetical protein